MGWSKEDWALALCALLSGKALDIISRLTASQVKQYELVKSSLLKGYDLTEEGYRLKFKQSKLHQGETYVQYACRIEKYFDRWVELSSYDDDVNGLKSLLIQEQVFDTCNKDLLMFIKERHPTELTHVLALADQFRDAHADPRVRRMKDRPNHSGAQQSSFKTNNSNTQNNSNKIPRPVPNVGKSREYNSRMPKKCYNCSKVGHISFNCSDKKGRREMGASLVTGRSADSGTAAGHDAGATGPTDSREAAHQEDHKGMSLIVMQNLNEDGT